MKPVVLSSVLFLPLQFAVLLSLIIIIEIAAAIAGYVFRGKVSPDRSARRLKPGTNAVSPVFSCPGLVCRPGQPQRHDF